MLPGVFCFCVEFSELLNYLDRARSGMVTAESTKARIKILLRRGVRADQLLLGIVPERDELLHRKFRERIVEGTKLRGATLLERSPPRLIFKLVLGAAICAQEQGQETE